MIMTTYTGTMTNIQMISGGKKMYTEFITTLCIGFAALGLAALVVKLAAFATREVKKW